MLVSSAAPSRQERGAQSSRRAGGLDIVICPRGAPDVSQSLGCSFPPVLLHPLPYAAASLISSFPIHRARQSKKIRASFRAFYALSLQIVGSTACYSCPLDVSGFLTGDRFGEAEDGGWETCGKGFGRGETNDASAGIDASSESLANTETKDSQAKIHPRKSHPSSSNGDPHAEAQIVSWPHVSQSPGCHACACAGYSGRQGDAQSEGTQA